MRAITVVGNIQADVVVRPGDVLPPPGGDLRVDDIAVRAAGAAANTALTLRSLGAPVRMVGTLGDDDLGTHLRAELASHGLDGQVLVQPGTRTGTSVCFEAPDRDRAFLTFLGGLEAFTEDVVPDDALAADLVLLCGYFCLPALRGEPTRRLLERVHHAGGTTLFDCGWDVADWPASTLRELDVVLPLVDVFLPNADEVCGLSGVRDPQRASEMLRDRSGGWVVTKLGADGCVAAGPGAETLAVRAPRVEVSDTTGAGDAFNAGVLLGLAVGLGWEGALRTAVRVASEVVSRPSHARFPARG
ncbi:MAG: carbohydrate kinase family protein [Streptosporangiaceae bacterium]